MWYDGTVQQIRQIIQWLESADEEGWPDQTDLVRETLSEVERMSASIRRPDKGSDQTVPGDQKMQQALPYVRAMVRAMKLKDRRRALENGRAALKEF